MQETLNPKPIVEDLRLKLLGRSCTRKDIGKLRPVMFVLWFLPSCSGKPFAAGVDVSMILAGMLCEIVRRHGWMLLFWFQGGMGVLWLQQTLRRRGGC